MTDAQDRLADILAAHAEAMRSVTTSKPKAPRGPILLPADEQAGYTAPTLSRPAPSSALGPIVIDPIPPRRSIES